MGYTMGEPIEGFEPEAVDPCPKGAGHTWIVFDKFRRRCIHYEVLICLKCTDISIGWDRGNHGN
jgi:hypothetical protein